MQQATRHPSRRRDVPAAIENYMVNRQSFYDHIRQCIAPSSNLGLENAPSAPPSGIDAEEAVAFGSDSHEDAVQSSHLPPSRATHQREQGGHRWQDDEQC